MIESQLTWLGIILAFTVGILGVLISVVQMILAGIRADRSRRLERRTDAYLELLRLCHIRARGIHATVNNIVNHDNLEHGLGSRLEVLKLDAKSDAEMNALRDAFASKDVATAHEGWTMSVSRFQDELDMLFFDGTPGQDSTELEALADIQRQALNVLGGRIRAELRF